jgi:hypothetical protein
VEVARAIRAVRGLAAPGSGVESATPARGAMIRRSATTHRLGKRHADRSRLHRRDQERPEPLVLLVLSARPERPDPLVLLVPQERPEPLVLLVLPERPARREPLVLLGLLVPQEALLLLVA